TASQRSTHPQSTIRARKRISTHLKAPFSLTVCVVLRIFNRPNLCYRCPFLYDGAHHTIGRGLHLGVGGSHLASSPQGEEKTNGNLHEFRIRANELESQGLSIF